jgi:hypothetical protein
MSESGSPSSTARPAKRQKTSKYWGVSLARSGQCWEAKINTNHKTVFLGSFESEEIAARVYDFFACKLKLRGFQPNLPNEPLEGELLTHANNKLLEITAHVSESQSTLNGSPSDEAGTFPRSRVQHNGKSARPSSSRTVCWQKAKENFRAEVADGPIYVCSCCRQLWFWRSVTCVTPEKKLTFPADCLIGVSNFGIEYTCWTCYRLLCKGKCPPLSRLKMPDSPPLPPELQELTDLENLLISPRIPFMTIRAMPRGKQLRLSGAVVNVPTDTQRIQTVLPRRWGTDDTVALKLKRRLRYKEFFRFENVRPGKILGALKYLCENSPLWQSVGVSMNASALSTPSEDGTRDCHGDQSDDENTQQGHVVENGGPNNDPQADPDDYVDRDSENGWSDDDEQPAIAGNDATMLINDHTAEQLRNRVLLVAPGEGSRPVGLVTDKCFEELSLPNIYAGQKRPEVKASYNTVCRWELRNRDRRAARFATNIFMKCRKLQAVSLRRAAWIRLRKTKVEGRDLTASMMLDSSQRNEILKTHVGWTDLKQLRGSPQYHEQGKKDVFAMLRQLGVPSFFIINSRADTRWPELLQALAWTVDHKQLSRDEVQTLSWKKRARLVRSDPVTCARYYRMRMETLIKTIKHCPEIIGPLKDFFLREEFQHRRSPHSHWLAFVDAAPVFEKDSDEKVCSWIDSFITCSSSNATIKYLINLQIHKHKKSCRRKRNGKTVFRFKYPLPSMDVTSILYPLPKDLPKVQIRRHEDNAQKLQKFLWNLSKAPNPEQSPLTFDQFFSICDLNLEDYLLAIQTSLKKPTIFLRRQVCDIRINAYNAKLLELTEANMDIQFVLDPYAAASYVVSYMMKGQRGMSKLMQRACAKARRGNGDVKECLRHMGNAFIRAQEIWIQEAVYLTMGLKLRDSSRSFQFIPSAPPSERTFLVKDDRLLEAEDPKSTNIAVASIVDRYATRPDIPAFENVSLAEFVAHFDRTQKNVVPEEDINEDQPPEEDTSELIQAEQPRDLSQVGYKVCTCPKVIRFVNYKEGKDPEKFYREQIFLFHPWRPAGDPKDLSPQVLEAKEDETLLQGCTSYEERYEQLRDLITRVRDLFVKGVDYEALEAKARSEDDDFAWGESLADIAPCVEHENGQDREQSGPIVSGNEEGDQYDLAEKLGGRSEGIKNRVDYVENMLDDASYRLMIRSLNAEQRVYFDHFQYRMKRLSDIIMHEFVSGGAGVGKSVLARAIIQTAIRIFNRRPESSPASLKVLIIAPTDTAAFNVGGFTIHSALEIPANQSLKHYKDSSAEQKARLEAAMEDVELIIHEEVSMTGRVMFDYINLRLQDIKGDRSKPFGGVHYIAFGDLFQLPPVFDRYIGGLGGRESGHVCNKSVDDLLLFV